MNIGAKGASSPWCPHWTYETMLSPISKLEINSLAVYKKRTYNRRLHLYMLSVSFAHCLKKLEANKSDVLCQDRNTIIKHSLFLTAFD